MIRAELYDQALRALQRLIVHAKSQALRSGEPAVVVSVQRTMPQRGQAEKAQARCELRARGGHVQTAPGR